MNSKSELTPERWRAIVENDRSYDGAFLYAVKTTGIFCRPSCKSRAPQIENVRIFQNAEQALAAGFRPCKRCRPDGALLPDEELAEQVAHIIATHYREPLTLKALADISHVSPFHLQRIFKRIKGVSPVDYIRQKRISEAGKLLASSNQPMAEIAAAIGIANADYFAVLFKKIKGQTPTEYRQMKRRK
ncbi:MULTISPECIES: bifunctional transcriptional activator/DNA repair enzyme AdaA [Bacillus]|uniref:bifunctional transcriptional activator/DNA repair enzyme AdaA n=1 Tax=Bacillus TaxID=1386 RepID=UPI0003FC296E|nr:MULTISPECIES: Ada metal-binding domain-containing protein [Bacillus]QHZ47827.1 methylphosphotriester-DNA--protein-cysteine methyltransferase family protein [Bacillus sp. NSP9.1]WFA03906.1 Ada metal-binding domain-containing protein [Bacillus sp. HSf4]